MTEFFTNQNQLSKELKNQAFKQGFHPVGIASIPGSNRIKLRTQALERWLEGNLQGEMKWMEAPRRKNIETLLNGVKSVLAVGLNYFVDEKRKPENLLIARYAWGSDYHKVVEQKLKVVGRWLEEQRPKSKWRIYIDTGPLLDKAWAEEAGIGWIGKNSNLINPNSGSWMVIGHLLSTEQLTSDKPMQPLCGKCRECLTACPTQAITEPFVVDSRKCLAYHTIENRNDQIPKEISSLMGKWIAGCDICQEVCPWNQKSISVSSEPEMQPKEWILNITKENALKWTDETWNKNLRGSALKRIKPWMWRRNIQASN